MACPNPYPQCPHAGSLAAASHQAASSPIPALARHCCAPTHGSSSSSQSKFWPTAGLQSSLPEPRALLLTARPQLPPGLEMGREPLWTRAQGSLGRAGVGWGSSTIPAAQCQWALPALRLVPREATKQSPLGHGRAMSGLPEHLPSPSQLLSCVLLAYPGQNSAPSAVWAGLNQPGSVAWSPAARARGRAAALCAEWTRSQHHVACHHARPTHWRGMRRRLNSPGPAHHWLGFLGSHSRPPKREEFSHMGGSQGPEQEERGQREDMS